MKITALLENTAHKKELHSAHGLSLYIETARHKILFDTGPNGLFAENARKLGVDLAAVDTLVISHGHSDHGGGLRRFLEVNRKAKIYLRPNALQRHTIKVFGLHIPVSLNARLLDAKRMVITRLVHPIDEELTLFSDARGTRCLSSSNAKLYKWVAKHPQPDDFDHEHNLLVTDGGRTALFAGCAHRGIVNILDRAQELTQGKVDAVVAGFHLYNPAGGKAESTDLVDGVAAALGQWPAQYYTCHCTGHKAFARMRQSLGERMRYLATGDTIAL